MQLYTYINIHIMQLLPCQGELGEILAQLSTGIRSLDGTLHSVKRRREKARKPAGWIDWDMLGLYGRFLKWWYPKMDGL